MVGLCPLSLEVRPPMTKILDFFLNPSGIKACNAYPDGKSLFEGLAQEAPDAIRCLSSKIAGPIYTTYSTTCVPMGRQLVDP